MPFERGAKASELDSSGALVKWPFEGVLPLSGIGSRQRAHCDAPII